ncbi:LpqN/LpqT family lipoprotein, partial [Mycolicibacterium pulveris]
RRHVIATAGPDRYLVSLAVTTSLDQVVPAAEATDAIVRGFRVSVPAPAAPPAPAPPAPGAAPAPAALPATPAPPSVPAAASQALANTGPS